MRKKLILGGALFLALVISVGTFAYTFTAAGTTLTETAVGAGIATSAPASGQPDWGPLLPHSQPGLEVLRPNGTGDETDIQKQMPDSGFHWQKVAEPSPDEFATTVYTTGGSAKMDLYNLQDHAQGSGTINGVAVYFRFTATDGGVAHAKAAISTDGEVDLGDQESQGGGVFVTKSYMWETNPDTRRAWTWSEIDALQAGVQLDRASGGGSVNAVCTQVYVVVYFTIPPVVQGDVPAGNLFLISPNPAYTGDLMVKIYLTNTGSLTKAYRYLNMKVKIPGSIEAGQTPDYQVLSPENGVAVFNIVGGASGNYTAQITGGSYAVLSGDSTQWPGGWTLTPEFYSEVSAR